MKKSICLIILLFLFTFVYSADLKFDGSNKIKTGSLVKGLVGHWMLDSESEKKFSSADWDGDNDLINVGSDSSIDDIFDSGGTVSVWIKADSGGENNAGYIFGKRNGWVLYVTGESAEKIKISFIQDFSDTDGGWPTTNTLITIGAWTHIAVSYDNGAVANNPTIYVNGTAYTVGSGLDESTPVGTRVSDASAALYLGNTAGGSRTFDGSMTDMRLYDETKNAADIAIIANKGNINRPVVQTDLVAWYPLNDYDDHSTNTNDGTNDGTTMTQNTAADLTPYGNTGTVYGTNYTTDQKGQSNRAMSFDGEDDYVNCGDDASIQVAGGIITIAFWINVDAYPATHYALVGTHGHTSGYRSMMYSSGHISLSIGKADGGINDYCDNAVGTGWHHFAVTYDPNLGSANKKFYVDGVPDGTTNKTDPILTSSAFRIGITGGQPYFNGTIDEVHIYSRALSQEEITLLHESYRPYFIMSGE